jgi:hypothetical protein
VPDAGRDMVIRWGIDPENGQRVRFAERAPDGFAVVANTGNPVGSQSFTPFDGAGGGRNLRRSSSRTACRAPSHE